MSGNALPVLRALYHEGREFSVPLRTGEAMSQSLLEALRDLCISSTAQLVQLLVLGSDSREVATQVLTSEPEHEENAVSFRENIFSELAVRLNASGFPLEVHTTLDHNITNKKRLTELSHTISYRLC